MCRLENIIINSFYFTVSSNGMLWIAVRPMEMDEDSAPAYVEDLEKFTQELTTVFNFKTMELLVNMRNAANVTGGLDTIVETTAGKIIVNTLTQTNIDNKTNILTDIFLTIHIHVYINVCVWVYLFI